MSTRRPDLTDEEIGMRAFQLRKAKAVERAVERLRHSLGREWSELDNDEIEELEWILGELWAYVARDQWDNLHFGHLALRDIRGILRLGRELRRHSRNAVDILQDIAEVVIDKS